jgi:hypothetical protein
MTKFASFALGLFLFNCVWQVGSEKVADKMYYRRM